MEKDKDKEKKEEQQGEDYYSSYADQPDKLFTLAQ